ncbi:unnamed protein product [Lactuca saligna]|uniref:Uncharacterized protein n=1 Tax=Lactuca saligna TaxID=75948 RepID=A0AA35Z311_LACSI|nr:unnamed protein product [Lactuca saligna]
MCSRTSILLACYIMSLWVFLNDSHKRSVRKFITVNPIYKSQKVLTLISNERQYKEFIDIAYECGVQVSVYMDHFGTTLHVTKAYENENEDNCSVKSNISIEGEEGIDHTEIKIPQEINMEGVTYEGVSQGNGNEEATEGDPKDDKDDNVPDVKGKPMFNENIPWKKQLSILVKGYWLSVVMVNAQLGFGHHG